MGNRLNIELVQFFERLLYWQLRWQLIRQRRVLSCTYEVSMESRANSQFPRSTERQRRLLPVDLRARAPTELQH